MQFELRSLIGGVILPAGVAFTILVILLHDRNNSRPEMVRHFSAMGVGLGFAAAYAALGWAPLVPTAGWHWLPCLVLISTIYTEHSLERHALPRWCTRIVIAALAAVILVPPWILWLHFVVWPLILAATMCVLWAALSNKVLELPDSLSALLLALTLGCSAVVLMLSGNAKFAQLAIAGAAALGGAWLAGLTYRSTAAAAGARPLVAILLPGIMAEGWFYTFGQIPWYSFALIVAAPIVWAGVCAVSLKPNRPRRLILEIVALMLPCILAVGFALAVDSGE